MQESIIHTAGLVKSYASAGKRSDTVLHGINLEVFPGEFTIIMGSSGSGKSTLLYLLGGLDQATAGSIRIRHQMLNGRSEKELALLRRRFIGLVLQQNNLIPHLTLLENVMLPALLLKAKPGEAVQRARQLLDRFGLDGLRQRLPEEVSGGEQQRAAIARALINQPAVLLADEPTGSLNSAASGSVLAVLQELNEGGQTIVMVTHDIRTAGHGHRVLFMKDGLLEGDSLVKDTGHSPEEHERRLLTWLTGKGW